MDIGEGRTRVSDIIFLGTESERVELENPLTEKLYLVFESNTIYLYRDNEWLPLNTKVVADDIEFNNSETELKSTNVQDAIIELSNLFQDTINKINEALDEINGEKV